MEGRKRGKETREIEVFLACTKFRDSPHSPHGKMFEWGTKGMAGSRRQEEREIK